MSSTDYQPSPSTPQPGWQAPPPTSGKNGLAIAGFALALFALLGSWIPFLNIGSAILGVIAVVLAVIGLAKAKTAGAGKGFSIAGIILGVLAVIVSIVVSVAFFGAVDSAIKESTETKVATPSGSGDSDAGESRDNPAPLGSAITGGDWTVTVNSVTPVEQDSLGEKAAAGSTLLEVNLTAKYTGDDPQGASAWSNIKFVGADGTTISPTDGSTYFMAEDAFDSLKTVYEGGSVKGNELIEVPADGWEDGVLAVSPDLLSDDTFVAVK